MCYTRPVSEDATQQGLSLPTKVFLSFAVIIVAFSLVIGFAIINQWRTRQTLTAISTDLLGVSLSVIELRNTQEQLVTRLESEPDRWLQWITLVRQLRPLKIRRTMETIRRAQHASLPPETAGLLNELAEELDDVSSVAEEQEAEYRELFEAISNRDDESAEAVLGPLTTTEGDLSRRLFHVHEQVRDAIGSTTNDMRETEQQLMLALLALTTLALVIAAGLTFFSYKSLAPLSRLTEGVIAVGAGDLDHRVDISGRDEIGTLAREFNLMTERLVEREERLRRSERLAAIGKFVAKVTHDIRNPLNAIGLRAELLQEDITTLITADEREEPLNNLATIMERVQYLEALTQEYLAFARPTMPVLAQHDLDEVIEKFAEQERSILAEYSVKLELELAHELPPVGLDVTQIGRVLSNLVRNAREAMDQGGVLALKTRCLEDGVELVVEDTGHGMSEDDARKVFEEFFTTKERGTGLGLHTTEEIVTQHGGTIRCSSVEGEGTTFTLWFPCTSSADAPSDSGALIEEDDDDES